MSRIMEELASEAIQRDHVRIIREHRADGLDDETIARCIRKPLEYVQKVAPPDADTIAKEGKP